MARNQTRRCISIQAEVGARLKAYCEAHGIAMSALVEDLLAPVIARVVPPEHEDLLDADTRGRP